MADVDNPRVRVTMNSSDELVPREEVMRSLSRILKSSPFAQSNRLSNFLRYAVEETLRGEGESLKEYTIGTHAYGRKPDFDPSQDTIVRTEARRLRRKLKEYYELEGLDDKVVIFFRAGSYIPVMRWRESLGAQAHVEPANVSSLWTEGDGIWVTVTGFEAQKDDTAASSFAFGVTEEIRHRLTRVRGVRVVEAVGAVLPQADKGPALSVGGAMSPQVFIGGTVRREGGRLRIAARMITAVGHVIWSQRFETSIEAEILLEEQEKIAAALLSRVSPRDGLILRYLKTPTPILYSYYSEVLAAEALLEEGSISNICAALKSFEDLLVKLPEHTRVLCGVAQCCIALVYHGLMNSAELIARAEDLCKRALALDPDVAEAHGTLACVRAVQWRWGEAESCFRTAISLGDSHTAHRQFSTMLMVLSRFDEARNHLQIADELDSFSIRQRITVSHFLYYTRAHQKMEEQFPLPASFYKAPFEPYFIRALSSIAAKDTGSALAIANGLLQQANLVPIYRASVAELFALCGDKAGARSIIDAERLLDADGPLTHFYKSTLALALGEKADALKHLQRSLQESEPELARLRVDPRFDPIRDDDAYLSIVRKVMQH